MGTLRPSKTIQCPSMDPVLMKAARSGNTTLFNQLASQNPNLHLQVTPQKNTALHISARHGHYCFIVEACQKCPSLITAENSKGDTALHIAARAGYIDSVICLIGCARNYDSLETGNNGSRGITVIELVRKQNGRGNTALHEAVRHGHLKVVELLTEADPESACLVNSVGVSPLYLAAEAGSGDIVRQILQTSKSSVHGGLTAYGGPIHRTPLHASVIWGHFDIVKKLIEVKPELIKQEDTYGATPLHYAASQGNLNMVREFLQADASVAYIVDKDGRSPIHMAASNGHDSVIQELVFHHPDSTELLDANGRNALHLAIEREKPNVVRHILKSDELEELINEPDNNGNTPLHLAIIKRNLSIVYLLLNDERVDVRAMNNDSLTALDVAESDTELCTKLRKILICTALRKVGALRGRNRQEIQENTGCAVQGATPRIESYKAMAKIILVLAVLIATVSFGATFTMPGGYENDGPSTGMATLRKKLSFAAFLVTDAVAMFSSIAAALILICAGIGDQDLLVGSVSLATRLMAIALGSLTLAFLAGIWSVVCKWLGVTIILIFFAFLFLALLALYYQFSHFLLPFRLDRRPARQFPKKIQTSVDLERLLVITPIPNGL
ncbi:ankyrin repeat-containing protein At5g02620-like isoform X1 [Magnolia sinica]|uniref:ankyrin repeat-containing protein At5g02620-like isoform X1 n=1 Tax=Magnolia sinica TaxID=86752 RepID=UPI00265B0888|nr:ankyrin repeat-containing protein At5g02620-like isoform X1 [Magnolia sinica]